MIGNRQGAENAKIWIQFFLGALAVLAVSYLRLASIENRPGGRKRNASAMQR